MKFLKYFLLVWFTIISLGVVAQVCPTPGDNNGKPGCPDTANGCKDSLPFPPIDIEITAPADPNEIIGPKGYSTLKWVSVKSLHYKVLFENDPKMATAPAQKVIIYLPIHPNLNPNALRISDFGFGKFIFTVPPNTTTYTRRLDVRDSLGVFVDITTGLDLANRRAFWIFQSIDTATGLAATLPADQGFLPVNDSTRGNGEGFVTLSIQPISSAKTRDSISAQAFIIFDINEPVATNIETNTIDAVAPSSKINILPSLVESEFTLSWTGKDDSLGVGVQYYDVFFSKNNGPFNLYRQKLDSMSTIFSGEGGATYSFYTIATDFTGNREAAKSTGDQIVTIKGTSVLVSVKAFLQGAYNTITGKMIDSLRVKTMLPTNDPYRSLGFNPVNNLTPEIAHASVFDSVENKAVTDWVWLELRNSTNPSQIMATRSALVRRDGSVVDMDGYSPVHFNSIAEGNYYVAIRHRNHFGIMTASALALNRNTSTMIDFTSPATSTYGTDAQRNMNGVMVLWAGDINKDGRIKYNGAANDKVLILSKVGVANPNNIVTLYDKTDLNLDGRIKYNGAANDKTIILNNVGVATPNNILTEQLPN